MDLCSFGRIRLAIASLVVLIALGSAEAATVRVTTMAQQAGPGEGCTITEAIQLVGLSASAVGPGIRPGEPLLGNCTVELGGDGITIIVPAGEYVLTTPYLNIDGQAGFPLIGPTNYPFIGVPWGVRMVGDPAGGTIITRDTNPATPAFRFFRVQTWLELEHLTLSGGDGGAEGGGAIFGDDSLLAPCPIGYSGPCRLPITLRRVTFENNTAYFGGALSSTYRVYGQGLALTIEDSTFRGNHATGDGGAIRVPLGGAATIRGGTFENNTAGQGGGAIVSQALDPIEIEGTQFVGNQALNQDGGAIHAPYVRLTRGVLTNNTAVNGGGAIHSPEGRPVVIDTAFTGNRAQHAGAIFIASSAEIRGSTFVNNVATGQSGGAVEFRTETASSQLTNSTFSGNAAVDRGGAVYVYGGTLSINNVTFTGNTSGYGPGLALGWWGGSHVIMSNSIAAGNLTTGGTAIDVQVGGDDLQSLGYNTIGTDLGTQGRFASAGDLVGTELAPLNARLLPLADNGGPTPTHALAPTSPALDAGSNGALGTAGACEPADQRWMRRPGAGTPACDIGAFEYVITFPLTLVVGAGGSVVGLDGSTSCVDGECVGTFDSGTIVKLDAQAADDYRFVGWLGGGCPGASPVCFVTMDAAQTVTATFQAESAATTTTLSSSANPAVNGQDVTFTAVVSAVAPGSGTPTGSVMFVNVTEGSVIGTAPLTAGTATLTRTPRSSAQELNEIKAIYTGDGTFTPSSDTLQQVVSPASTAIALTSSAAPSITGQPVTITAVVSAVSPGSGTPTGSATFTDTLTSTVLGTVPLDDTGTASVNTALLPSGIRPIQVSYSGDQWFVASQAFIQQIVNAAVTTTVVSSSANPVLTGQPLTITATVAVTGSPTRTPTGSVTFEDMTANVSLGSGTLNANGVATINPTLAIGTHTIVANYAGDSFVGASSGSLEQVTLATTVNLDIREEIIVSDAVGLLPSAMLSVEETVVVSDAVTPLRSAMLSVAETIVVHDTLDLAPQSNTLPGNNVLVPAAGVPVAMTFAQIVKPGFTSVVAATGPAPPSGFRLTSPPTSFEITTSAVYAGAITVCIGYPASSLSPRLMHFEAGRWVDRTTSVNASTRTVCGSVTSLSPFAVFEPEGVEGRMTGDGATAIGHEFDFRVAERSIGNERGALRYTHKTPKSGKQKARTDTFRATSIGEITFWDDPAYRPSRRSRPAVDSVVFTGTGKWNGAEGYSFEVEAADEGEPGRGRDTFTIVIRDPQGAVVASSDGVLTAGNIQSQRLRKRLKGDLQ